jgi:hypothetical protein
MRQTLNSEIILTLVDELPAKYNQHMIAGWKRIDRYRELEAVEQAERDRLSKLADEARQVPKMPY